MLINGVLIVGPSEEVHGLIKSKSIVPAYFLAGGSDQNVVFLSDRMTFAVHAVFELSVATVKSIRKVLLGTFSPTLVVLVAAAGEPVGV